MELQVGKWGNSLALRLPSQLVRKLRLHQGARVELEIGPDGKATISPAPPFDKAGYLARVRCDAFISLDQLLNDNAGRLGLRVIER